MLTTISSGTSSDRWKNLSQYSFISLPLPGQTDVGIAWSCGHWKTNLSWISHGQSSKGSEFWFDSDKLIQSLILQNWAGSNTKACFLLRFEVLLFPAEITANQLLALNFYTFILVRTKEMFQNAALMSNFNYPNIYYEPIRKQAVCLLNLIKFNQQIQSNKAHSWCKTM